MKYIAALALLCALLPTLATAEGFDLDSIFKEPEGGGGIRWRVRPSRAASP